MADGLNAAGGVPDGGFGKRVKALALTGPLHELDARRGRVEWADASVYCMAELALHAIDIVAIAQDFETGAAHEYVIERLSEFVRKQAPERPAAEWRAVARWVLAGLINSGDVERGFRASYSGTDEFGGLRRLIFRFKLLEERRDERGDLVLRASNEALNVLVGALDTDVESAQEAAEVRLRNLIRRGKLEDAKLVAEQARLRTVQLGEDIRVKLDATRRDVRSVDWLETMPGLLNEALDHVEERIVMERGIATQVAEMRDGAQNPVRKRAAAELVDIVEDCVRRHTVLQRRLMGAREVFREEQDRQEFSGRPDGSGIDLYGSLLLPMLDLKIGDATGPADRFFSVSETPAAEGPAHLASFVPLLLKPPPERPRLADPVPEPDLPERIEHGGFTDEEWRAAEALLDLPATVRSLSDLLVEAAASGLKNLPELVALLALHSYGPEAVSGVRRGERTVRLAVLAGVPLDVPGFGGDDLFLTSASVAAGDRERPDEP